MADNPNSQDLLSRAQSLLNQRLALVEEHKRNVDAEQDARNALSEAEKRSAYSWNAMLTAGWSVGELRQLGFREPSVRPPGRPRKTVRKEPASPVVELPGQSSAESESSAAAEHAAAQ